MWSRTAKLLALFLICLDWPASCAGDEVGTPTLQGALLLRNGEVLEGAATRSGDRFTLELRSGGQLRIPVADVEFFGHDAGQVYRHLLGQVEPKDADQYLQLSHWCFGQGMLKESAQCLQSVSRLDPHHSGITRMEQRLLEAARRRPSAAAAQRAAHEEKREVAPPTLVELPAGVVSEFSRRIQPILLNGCAAAACHRSPTQAAYRLHIPPRNRPMPRHLTLENLRSTLAWTENDDVDASQLLVKARTLHGAASETRVSHLERKHYARLRNWIRQARVRRVETDSHVARANYEGHVEAVADAEQTADRPGQQPNGEPNRGEKDPFDPEIFNQKFLEPDEIVSPDNDGSTDSRQVTSDPEVDSAGPPEP